MSHTEHDVVIVGAGPVGLALAFGLARVGLDVLVLEGNSSTAEHSRAQLIWPRVLMKTPLSELEHQTDHARILLCPTVGDRVAPSSSCR